MAQIFLGKKPFGQLSLRQKFFITRAGFLALLPASLGLASVGVDDGDAGQSLGDVGVFSLRLRRHSGSVEAGLGQSIRSKGGRISWNGIASQD